jgi:hypothetical protein
LIPYCYLKAAWHILVFELFPVLNPSDEWAAAMVAFTGWRSYVPEWARVKRRILRMIHRME